MGPTTQLIANIKPCSKQAIILFGQPFYFDLNIILQRLYRVV